MSSHHSSSCASCLRPQNQLTVPLKQCAKCHKTVYCSRECQKTHWKAHKSTCRSDNTFHPTSMFPFPPVNGNASGRIPEDVLNTLEDPDATNQELKDAFARIKDRGAVRDLITEAGLADPGASSPPVAQAGEKVVEVFPPVTRPCDMVANCVCRSPSKRWLSSRTLLVPWPPTNPWFWQSTRQRDRVEFENSTRVYLLLSSRTCIQ